MQSDTPVPHSEGLVIPCFYLHTDGQSEPRACTGSELFWNGTSLGEDTIFETAWTDGCVQWFDAIREKPGSDVWGAISLFRKSLRTMKVGILTCILPMPCNATAFLQIYRPMFFLKCTPMILCFLRCSHYMAGVPRSRVTVCLMEAKRMEVRSPA